MSPPTDIARRRFLTASALAASVGLTAISAPALGATGGDLVLYDDGCASGRRFAAAASAGGAACVAIAGDRVRAMRALLDRPYRPARIVGLGRYADCLLLAGTAADAGYRLIGEARHARDGTHACAGVMAGASALLEAAGDAWPEALSQWLVGARTGCGSGRHGTDLASWVAIARS